MLFRSYRNRYQKEAYAFTREELGILERATSSFEEKKKRAEAVGKRLTTEKLELMANANNDLKQMIGGREKQARDIVAGYPMLELAVYREDSLNAIDNALSRMNKVLDSSASKKRRERIEKRLKTLKMTKGQLDSAMKGSSWSQRIGNIAKDVPVALTGLPSPI